MTEYVIKKSIDFRGIPYSILFYGFEHFTGFPRSVYETDEYVILTKAEYDKKVEVFCVEFCGKWKEITEQYFDEKLNILPPLEWKDGGFFISEAYTLDIHPFYQEYLGKYYGAYFRIDTPRNEIMQSLAEFVKAQEKEVA